MKFLCEQCKAKYQIADDKVAGKTVRMKCRKCGHLIEVRAAVTESSVTAAPVPDRPSAPSAGVRPMPPRSAPIASSLVASRAAPGKADPPPPAAAPGALEGAFKAVVQREDEVSTPFDMSDLSPSDEWYVAINGVPVGPIRVAEVRRKAALGAVSEESLVWQEGLDEWRPLRFFPELAASVREAITSARASRPPAADGRSSLPPPPPSRIPPARSIPAAAASPPRSAGPAVAAAPPPRVSAAPPSPAAPAARSNVVPIMSRLATAERLDELAPGRVSPIPGTLPVPTAGHSVVPDPFAAPAASAPAVVAAAPSAVTAATSASSIPPARPKRATPWIAVAMVATAIAFGVTAALALFLRPTPPATTVAPPRPPPSVAAAAPSPPVPAPPAPSPEAPPEPIAVAAPPPKPRAASGSSKAAAAAAAAAASSADPAGAGAGGSGRSLDLHALTQNVQTVTPTDEPGGGESPKAAGQTLTSGQVMQVVQLHQVGVRRACWERNPTNKPVVSVEVKLNIGPDGAPQSVTANGDDPSVSKCIENDVKNWRFPATGSSQWISIPFKFVKQ